MSLCSATGPKPQEVITPLLPAPYRQPGQGRPEPGWVPPAPKCPLHLCMLVPREAGPEPEMAPTAQADVPSSTAATHPLRTSASTSLQPVLHQPQPVRTLGVRPGSAGLVSGQDQSPTERCTLHQGRKVHRRVAPDRSASTFHLQRHPEFHLPLSHTPTLLPPLRSRRASPSGLDLQSSLAHGATEAAVPQGNSTRPLPACPNLTPYPR